MGQQIRFFEKNYVDINNEFASISVSDGTATNDGADILDFLRNRNNYTAWVTSGSTGTTTLTFNFGSVQELTKIILVEHNLENYTIEANISNVWTHVASAASNTASTTFHSIQEVLTDQVRIIMTDAQDKRMFQTIFTRDFKSGQLESWVEISGSYEQSKKVNSVLSGKANITQSLGAFSVNLKCQAIDSSADIALIEEMYERFYEGFLMWISGGDESQFKNTSKLWRNKDIMLVRPVNNYQTSWLQNLYKTGNPINIQLREVIR